MKGVTHQIVLLATLRGFVCRSVNLSVLNCKYVCLGRYTPLPPPCAWSYCSVALPEVTSKTEVTLLGRDGIQITGSLGDSGFVPPGIV